MNYVIFNQDGSIREQAFGYYIQQGDNADTIFVSVEGFTSEYVCNAFLTLPTTETLLLAGAYQNNVEYKEGEFADGWVITLSGRATEFNGSVMCAIRLFLNNQIKLSYPLMLIVNETGYRPNEDTGITIEEINSYLQQLQSYQLKYDLHNVRYYSSYSDYQLDLANLESGQLAIVKEGENIFAYVDNGKIDFDYATKQYVEKIANTKLDKNTSSGGFERVYGVDVGGNQKMFSTDRDYTLYKFENNLVKRFANGQIALPLLPDRDENAISKYYGDLTYATKEDVANIYDILYDTIFVSAEEDFSGVNFIIPSTLTLEDTLPHDIVDKLPLTLKAVKGRTWVKNQICSPLNSGNYGTTSVGGTLSNATENSILFTRSQNELTTNVTVIYQLRSAYEILTGEKCFIKADLTPSADCSVRLYAGAYQPNDVPIYANQKNHIEAVITATSNAYPLIIISHSNPLPLGGTLLVENFKCVNLTKMFGAGNEPTTVEQFNELTRNIDLSAFDEGSFINVNITELKSYGEYVDIDLGTANWAQSQIYANRWASVNILRNKPAKSVPVSQLGNAICSGGYKIDTFNHVYTGATNMTFAIDAAGVNIYLVNNDFENYTPEQVKQSLQGVILKYQPNNPLEAPVIDTVNLTVSDLNGINTAQDTITWDETNRIETKVIEKVDLGSLNYSYSETNEVFTSTTSIPCKPNQNYDYANIKCIKYIPTRTQGWNEGIDKSISINNSGQVVIKDTTYQDPATLKNDLFDVILYYELNIPTITTTTETALDIDFQTGGYLTIDSEVWADITAEFLVKDWSK